MAQAITTKYLGPTDHQGARISVRCQATRITVAWDDGLDVEANHRAAALKLITRLGWDSARRWYCGALPDDTGYAFVMGNAMSEVK